MIYILAGVGVVSVLICAGYMARSIVMWKQRQDKLRRDFYHFRDSWYRDEVKNFVERLSALEERDQNDGASPQ